MKCMEEGRSVGLTRADENVSWNGVAIGGETVFCTNHHINPHIIKIDAGLLL